MNDLVQRLRNMAQEGREIEPWQLDPHLYDEAADEIERLQAMSIAPTSRAHYLETCKMTSAQFKSSIRKWADEYPGDPEALRDALILEIERLEQENWQLRQACGYPIPADKETINNPFKCGTCDAMWAEAKALNDLLDDRNYIKELAALHRREEQAAHQPWCAKVIAANNETPWGVRCDCRPGTKKTSRGRS